MQTNGHVDHFLRLQPCHGKIRIAISSSHLRLIETLCYYITRLLLSPLLVLASQLARSLMDRFQNSLKLL